MTGFSPKQAGTATVMTVCLIVLMAGGCGLWKKTAGPETVREPEPPASVGGYSIQFGLFDTQQEAEKHVKIITEQTGELPVIMYKPPFYRVHLVESGDVETVDRKVQEFQALGFESARRVFTYDK